MLRWGDKKKCANYSLAIRQSAFTLPNFFAPREFRSVRQSSRFYDVSMSNAGRKNNRHRMGGQPRDILPISDCYCAGALTFLPSDCLSAPLVNSFRVLSAKITRQAEESGSASHYGGKQFLYFSLSDSGCSLHAGKLCGFFRGWCPGMRIYAAQWRFRAISGGSR